MQISTFATVGSSVMQPHMPGGWPGVGLPLSLSMLGPCFYQPTQGMKG